MWSHELDAVILVGAFRLGMLYVSVILLDLDEKSDPAVPLGAVKEATLPLWCEATQQAGAQQRKEVLSCDLS